MYRQVSAENERHDNYLENAKKFQIPMHEVDFSPVILGTFENDLWDNLTVLLKISVQGNDYPVFQACIEKAFFILESAHTYAVEGKINYQGRATLAKLNDKRFHSIFLWLVQTDKESVFTESIVNWLCERLSSSTCFEAPEGTFTKMVASELKWVCGRILKDDPSQEPIQILNAFHAFLELTIQNLISAANESEHKLRMTVHTIAAYVPFIKVLHVPQ